MRAIYKRELKSYFHSMIGYVFIAFLIAFTGVYFMAYNLNYGYPYFSYVLSGVLIVFIVAIPVLTMRSFAEERKSKTDQMLLTAPVSLFEVVMGKHMAMVSILAVPCLVYLIFPLIIKTQGTAYILEDYMAIFIFFLLGCTYLSIGMFISSLTESQIIAAIASFGILMLQYLWNGLLDMLPTSALSNMIGVLALFTLLILIIWHMTENVVIAGGLEVIALIGCIVTYAVKSSLYESALNTFFSKFYLAGTLDDIISNHLVDVSGIIMYLSLTVVFIYLTMQMIQKRRWS
ncbi:MAG: ABC transporter permease subunit [Lachnospiraceae bacterium]|nr:ABC transporter permease subunit [Lachnospiraceae bacterium]